LTLLLRRLRHVGSLLREREARGSYSTPFTQVELQRLAARRIRRRRFPVVLEYPLPRFCSPEPPAACSATWFPVLP